MYTPTDLSLHPTDILRTALTEVNASNRYQQLEHQFCNLTSPPPVLSTSSKPNTLVRFRCMVQDTTLAPEIFLPVRSGDPDPILIHGRDHATQLDEDIDYAKLRERTVVWAVGVPGESDWVEELLHPSAVCPALADDTPPNPSDPVVMDPLMAQKFPHAQAQLPGTSNERLGAYIKFYDSKTFTPTSLYSITGLLTYAPHSSNVDYAPIPSIHVLSSTLITPQSSFLPLLLPISTPTERSNIKEALLRYIAVEGLGNQEPEWVAKWILIGMCSGSPPLSSERGAPVPQTGGLPISISLLPPLAGTLSNSDSPHLPTTATPATVTSDCPLQRVFSSLMPTVHTLPLSIERLNTSSFAPKSRSISTDSHDHPSSSSSPADDDQHAGYHNDDGHDLLMTTTEDLSAGALQLPSNSILFIDERPMGNGGILNQTGLDNVQCLTNVVGKGKIEYEFPFSKFGFDMGLGGVFVVGDEKGGTLLPVDVKIPLSTSTSLRPLSSPSPSPSPSPPSSTALAQFRSLLLSLHTPSSFSSSSSPFPSYLSSTIQEAFIAHRQRYGVASLSGDDLGIRIRACKVWAKILGLDRPRADQGQGKEEEEERKVWEGCWKEVWEMDEARLERVRGKALIQMEMGGGGEKVVDRGQEGLLGKPIVRRIDEDGEEEESEDELEIEGGPTDFGGQFGRRAPVGR